MGFLTNWLTRFIPKEYSIGVAIKKVSFIVGKLAVGFIVGKTAASKHLTPEQAMAVQAGVTTATAAGLEAIHDWAKLKWPDKGWLQN